MPSATRPGGPSWSCCATGPGRSGSWPGRCRSAARRCPSTWPCSRRPAWSPTGRPGGGGCTPSTRPAWTPSGPTWRACGARPWPATSGPPKERSKRPRGRGSDDRADRAGGGRGRGAPGRRGRVPGVHRRDRRLEAGVGGRLYERWHDGHEADWARVLAWEPPARLLLSWQPNPDRPAPTEVEVRFVPLEPDHTRVELEHRGWERLGDQGPESRAGYERGWPG